MALTSYSNNLLDIFIVGKNNLIINKKFLRLFISYNSNFIQRLAKCLGAPYIYQNYGSPVSESGTIHETLLSYSVA